MNAHPDDDGAESRQATPGAWTLVRHGAGDLPPGRAGAVSRMLEASPELRALGDRLRAEEEAFLKAHPWEQVRDGILARAARLPAGEETAAPSKGWPAVRWNTLRSWALALAGFGLAVVIGTVLLPDPGRRPARGAAVATDRVKGSGGGALQAWMWLDGEARPLQAGSVLQEGDRIQFRVTTPYPWLALLGVDGSGTVSRYVPVGGEMSAPFTPGVGRPLADSLVLDDAPGPELFLAFLSPEPLPVEDLERAIYDAVDQGPEGSRAALGVDWEGLHLAPQVGAFFVEKEGTP